MCLYYFEHALTVTGDRNPRDYIILMQEPSIYLFDMYMEYSSIEFSNLLWKNYLFQVT